MRFGAVLIAVWALVPAMHARAQSFRCVEAGKVVYQQVPCEGGRQVGTSGGGKATTAPGSKGSPGEPPEDVLIAMQVAEYEQINKAGGMPVTVTASGRSTVLKPKVWSAKKDGPCRAVPGYPDAFECSLSMMVTLREGERTPGRHAERLYVHWDSTQQAWRSGLPGPKKK